MACRLIINTDDLGWSDGVNAAICDLYDEGIVTSASLMVGASAVSDALTRLENRPGLAVGLHLALVLGQSVLPRREIPHLVDERGWFSNRCEVAGLRYTVLPACRREVRWEVAAQFQAFAALGLPWSHVDSHLHFALTPVFFRAALEAASAYPVVGWRVPEDDFAAYQRVDPDDARKQKPLALCFSALCRSQRTRLTAAGYTTTRYCYGLFRTGRLDAEYLARLVREMPDGDYELHCHPAADTEAGRREWEALRSPVFRRALADRGVILSTYPSLTSDASLELAGIRSAR